MTIEFIEGLIRLALPLCCISLAGLLYGRVGLVNIALDGQVVIAAICYVVGTVNSSFPIGLLLAFLVTSLIGFILFHAKEQLKLDALLVGIGLLYICYGSSRLICKVFFGNPGYALLGEGGIGELEAKILAAVICLLILVSEIYLRKVRVAKIIGESKELAIIEGINIKRWCIWHNLAGAFLISLGAIGLVEHGGSYTGQVSGGRGFLALAIVAIAGHRGWVVLVWTILFAAGQKLVYTVKAPSELMEATPYLLGILILVIRGFLKKN